MNPNVESVAWGTTMTRNRQLLDWVGEMTRLCRPDQVVWCDGSEQEKRRLIDQAVSDGVLLPLNQKKRPGCYLHRSNPNDVARVDWSEHLPKLAAFWCRALLGLPGYVGNPFRAHALVHARRRFTPAHFQRWLDLFHETLDLSWVGPRADRAHELADNVARVHSEQLIGRAVTVDRYQPT